MKEKNLNKEELEKIVKETKEQQKKQKEREATIWDLIDCGFVYLD